MAQVVRALDVEIQRFSSTYIVLSGYLDDAATKMQDIWSRATMVV